MKTLSIIQPWASLICSGIKDVESRSWAPPKEAIGQKILIHASAKKCSNSAFLDIPFEWLSEVSNAIKYGWIPAPLEIPTGAIIGYVDLVGCFLKTDSLWDPGDNSFKWLLNNAYMFDEPIPAKARPGIYETSFENLPPAHKVVTVVPHREGDVLVLPYSADFIDSTFKNGILDLDLTDDNLDLLALTVNDDYEPVRFKAIRLVTPNKSYDFPVVYSEIFLDSYVDTDEPIYYTSLRGEQYGKYKIAYCSESFNYFNHETQSF